MNLRRTQQGFTLLETLIVALIMTSVILGASALIDNYTQNLRLTATAQQLNTFGNAVQAYIKDDYVNVMQYTTPTVACVISVDSLTHDDSGAVTTKYLPGGFSPTNNYGQTLYALVLQPGVPTPPALTTGILNALVVTQGGTPPLDPANPDINDFDLSQIAALIGASGGAIYRNTPDATAPQWAIGTHGKWRFNITSDAVGQYFHNTSTRLCKNGNAAPKVQLTSGHPLIALWFGTDTSAAFLYRNEVPNHPELNKMVANLEFDASRNSTLKLNQITPNGATAVVIGDPCGQTQATNPPSDIQAGTLSADSSGRVLACQKSTANPGQLVWQAQGSLFWGDADVERFSDLPPCGNAKNPKWQTRIVKNPSVPLIGGGPRAYTCDNLNTWQPLAVDDQGILQLGTYQTEGWPCNKLGYMSMNSAGLLMSCQSNPAFPLTYIWTFVGSASHYEFDIWATAGALPFIPKPAVMNHPEFVGTGIISTDTLGRTVFTGTLWCHPRNLPVKFQRPGLEACGSGGYAEPDGSNLEYFAYSQALGVNLPWWAWNGWDNYGYSATPAQVTVKNLNVNPLTWKKLW